jgi:hypothetical protein
MLDGDWSSDVCSSDLSTDIVIKATEDALKGRLAPVAKTGPSEHRFPPPIWTWLLVGLTRGIW